MVRNGKIDRKEQKERFLATPTARSPLLVSRKLGHKTLHVGWESGNWGILNVLLKANQCVYIGTVRSLGPRYSSLGPEHSTMVWDWSIPQWSRTGPYSIHSNTPPQSELGAQRTFRLDLNSMKTNVGKPLVKMSAYWDEVGMCST
jgi:hypothetical protein